LSIQKISDRNFKVRYRVGGKQYTKSGFDTKTQAKAWESAQLKRVKDNTWTDPKGGSTLVLDVYTDWIEGINVSERTRSDYRELWKSVVAPHWERTALHHVTPSSVTAWTREITGRYSAARVRKAFTVFNQILDWAVADALISHNPAARAKEMSGKKGLLPAIPRDKANTYLSHEQVRALAEASNEYSLMILVMAYTGVRFGEATELRVKDINLVTRRLHVQRAVSDVRGRLVVGPPKSGEPREIPIPEFLIERISGVLSKAARPTDLLFTTVSGTQVRYSRWRSRHFNKAVDACALAGITPHSLRHSYAALAVQAGANVKVLQKAMGHSDIRLTLDTYGGLFGDDLDALAERMDAAASQRVSAENGSSVVPLKSAAD
jgi:integrase